MHAQKKGSSTANLLDKDTTNPTDLAPTFLKINPSGSLRFLAIFVLLLTVVHTFSLSLFYYMPHRNIPQTLFRMFDMGQDGNFPNLASAVLLFVAAALLFVIFKASKARHEHRTKNRWLLLSFIFLYLGIDEGAMIHDFISETIRSRLPFELPDFLWIAWVIPYFVFVMAVALYFFRFTMQLPIKTRNLFILSGTMYVSGALGIEMLESTELIHANAEEFRKGIKAAKVHVLETIEEVMELSGVSVFIYALLDYIRGQRVSFMISAAQPEVR